MDWISSLLAGTTPKIRILLQEVINHIYVRDHRTDHCPGDHTGAGLPLVTAKQAVGRVGLKGDGAHSDMPLGGSSPTRAELERK